MFETAKFLTFKTVVAQLLFLCLYVYAFTFSLLLAVHTTHLPKKYFSITLIILLTFLKLIIAPLWHDCTLW